jgi:hypothetical protein
MKLKTILLEMAGDTFQMYHGGQRWSRIPSELIGASKGRYEGGVGIYFTNSYQTAREYAKGGKVVQLVNIDKNFKTLDEVQIPVAELVDFVKNVAGMKKKKEIIQDLISNAQRRNKDTISLSILNNLVVNYEVGAGRVGVDVSNFFVSKGGDANVDRHSGDEFWMTVFNPKIIKHVSVVDPKTVDYKFPFLLPQPPKT